jgi:hypothetical protein
MWSVSINCDGYVINIKCVYKWKPQSITKNIMIRIYTWDMMAELVASASGVYF